MKIPGRGRRVEQERLASLGSGAAVDVPCRLRRTSARGWSPWIVGVVHLSDDDAEPTFVAHTPGEVSLLSGRAGRTGPVPLRATVRPSKRRVRFKGEAFHGADAEIIVLRGDPATVEIAVSVAETEGVFERIVARISPPSGV